MTDSVLLLDAGNTRLKWAVWRDGVNSDHGVHTYTDAPDGGVAEALTDFFNDVSRLPVDAAGPEAVAETRTPDTQSVRLPARAMVGSVTSSERIRTLSGWLDAHGVEVGVVRVRRLHGLRLAYEHPETLGVDRWLAMLGAQSLYNGPVCVADCGTALTLDSVTADGRHLGGMIIPGFDLMQRALLTQTAQIDEADRRLPQSLFGTTTGAAVNAGATCVLAAALDRFVEETTRELDSEPVVLVTGGGRERLLRYAHCDVIEVPDLVLLGLASLHGNDV